MTLELKHKKHTLFHLIAWLILIFILSNYAFFQTGELAANVFYRIAYAMAIFYLNYSFLVPRLLLNNKKLAYFFCVMLTIVCSKYLIETLFPNFAPISSVNRTAALVFFPKNGVERSWRVFIPLEGEGAAAASQGGISASGQPGAIW